MRVLPPVGDHKSSTTHVGRIRYERQFTIESMVRAYRHIMFSVAALVVLVDMDGVLVDWDRGFYKAWADRSPIDRTKSYKMEKCVGGGVWEQQANALMRSKGFFEQLPAMEGAIEAVTSMLAEGLNVHICTCPLPGAPYCALEKIEWIKKYLGEQWLSRLIICSDKVIEKQRVAIDWALSACFYISVSPRNHIFYYMRRRCFIIEFRKRRHSN
jgi:5'(3')-deoxyribonucleotidase